jgi:hypothetical protein
MPAWIDELSVVNKQVFLYLSVLFLLSVLLDYLKPGMVSRYLRLGLFALVVLAAGILHILSHLYADRQAKRKK